MTKHNTWSWGCTVPVAQRPNGDALDAYAVCPVCEAQASASELRAARFADPETDDSRTDRG